MRRITNILTKNWALITVILFGIFFRFFRFESFVTFLGDQGRDVIIAKRILSLEHLPAIGPPTSIGQVYLGPFYYYFITPWLLFFNYNPIGLAFGVAFFSSLYLLINYFIAKEMFDKKTALISTIFLSFSATMINFSRFSWNPNLLPLFTLLTVFFTIKSLQENKWYYYALLGSFLSFSLQLHYLVLFLFPPIFILFLINLIKKIKQYHKITVEQFKNYLLAIFAFVFFSSPLIVFDLRHQFLNCKNFITLFKSSGSNLLTKIISLFDTFYYLNLFSFNINLNKFFVYILFAFLLVIMITLIKKSNNLKTFLFIFIMTILGMSLYNGPKYPHYFVILYPLYFVIISHFFVFPKESFEKILTIVFIVGFIFLNFQRYPYFDGQGNGQISVAKNIAKKIYDNVKVKKYTVTALPEKYSDSTYRYFLEVWGKRAEEKDSIEKTDELFVVCEKKCPLIIGNPQWDIAFFAPNKIVGKWTVENVRIYKLIR
jgi:4-amino-4-deoxy-L-arabinose transferase-like glycosyltransferase